MSDQPHGNLTIRTLAMPADSNPSGDIFGGWVLSQMDIAGGICSRDRARCRTVTVALDRMSFIEPVKIGDVLCVYTEVVGVGNSSIDIHVEAWAQRDRSGTKIKVTEAKFKFVALDDDGRPTQVSK
ncbi:MAG: acyl-CoA thioesterase [Gammaproteobacteria bacterium]|nr:acyl-CoA thioesterase [Gammaproteobacteria bacterium]